MTFTQIAATFDDPKHQAVVLYRLPHAQHFRLLTQQGAPLTLASLDEVPLSGAYLIAPFRVTDDCPILAVQPDTLSEWPVMVPTLTAPRALTTDEDEQRRAYAASFAAVHRQLTQGGLNKVVLSRRLHVHTAEPLHPVEGFLKACHYRPNSFVALWRTALTGTWLIATPEPLLAHEHHQWRTVALAGTLPWTKDTAPKWNDKNREEQAIVARFIHEQLLSISAEVSQSATYALPTGGIQHLCTDFRFTLAHEADISRTLERLHPTPAVCGLPREEARTAIVQSEPTPRRYYAGFSGPLQLAGETHLFVSLRCMQLADDHLNATLYAGGGIMPESVEAEEWEETQRKLQTMRQLF